MLGDNGPLWSLANEFWYYIVFPLLFWGASKNSQYLFISRFFMVILAVTILALLPGILSGFVVWLFGVFVAAMQGRWIYGIAQRASFGLCASLFFLLILILSRSGGVSDIIIGCSFSLMLPWALGLSRYPCRCFSLDFRHFIHAVFGSFTAAGATSLIRASMSHRLVTHADPQARPPVENDEAVRWPA